MKVFFNINAINDSKVEVVNLIYNGSDYVEVRKNIIVRSHMTPFIYDIQTSKLKVYIDNLGEFTLSQDPSFDNDFVIHKVVKVNDVIVTDNNDLYEKLKVL